MVTAEVHLKQRGGFCSFTFTCLPFLSSAGRNVWMHVQDTKLFQFSGKKRYYKYDK